jgi:transcriptional regulator with XRE-family HTH domain
MAGVDAQQRVGRTLRAKRQRSGLTQEQLAGAADMHPTEVSRLERGVRDPRLSTLVRLARALDIELADLVRGVR